MSETQEITSWKCGLDMAVDGLPPMAVSGDQEVGDEIPLDVLTVGRKFLLRCQGEPVFLQRDQLKLVIDEKAGWVLKLLQVRRIDEKSADFLMTSYRPGKHQLASAKISDGTTEVELAPLSFEVQTVLQAQQGQPPKPYPPFGPIALAWPWYYWAILLGVILTAVLLIGRKVHKTIQRKKMIEELEQYTTALTPYNQFNKDLRKIYRDYGVNDEKDQLTQQLQSIDQAFRLYLVREFKVPALTAGDSEILREIRRSDKIVHEKMRKELRVALRELDKAFRDRGELTGMDCQQLSKLCQRTVMQVSKTRGFGGQA